MSRIDSMFQAAHPKAIDFVKTEYEANKEAIDAAAQAAGYRQAGVRLGFVVFTTKAPKQKITHKGIDLGRNT